VKDSIVYKTIQEPSQGLYKEKGSRFIAYAVGCRSEQEVKHYLEQWNKEHHQARHLCWAYRIGHLQPTMRAYDDGEPSNSAGMPILRQIRSFDLTNILIGVVRYFGGIKLGVGGLTNAYKQATTDALNNAHIVQAQVMQIVHIEFSYEQLPIVMNFLKNNKINYQNERFDLHCSVDVKFPFTQHVEFQHELVRMGVSKITELTIE